MTKRLLRNFFSLAILCLGVSGASAAIPSGYTLVPGENATVEKIETITLTKSGEFYLEVYVNRNIIVNGEVMPIDQENNLQQTIITMKLKTPITKSGSYNIVIPEGNFTYDYPEKDNPEISWTVIVDNPNDPEGDEIDYTVTPAAGSTVNSLPSLTIDFTGATAVTVNPDVQGAKVSFGGNDYDTQLSYSVGAAPSQVVVTLSNPVDRKGNCTVTLPEGLFSVTLADGKVSSPLIKASYTVDAPLGIGDAFMNGKLKYKVTSVNPAEVEVTWTSNEADYNGITTVPTSVTNDGITYAVTSIGELAFSFVLGLKDFTVPEGIRSIEKWAFSESSLETISLPSTLTRLGMGVFDVCESLTEITFPDGVTDMGEDMLQGCVKLQKVVLPKNLTVIPDNFMAGCISVPSVEIPETVTEIGDFAFSECEILTGLQLPKNLKTIKAYSFASTINLTELEIPETVTEIGNGMFYKGGLMQASLPDNFTVLPNTIYGACTGITSYVVGNKIREIQDMAFFWCFELKEITFGENVARIGDKVFTGVEKLETVICLNPVPASGAAFEQIVYDNATLYVPEEAVEAYSTAEGWKNFKNIRKSSGVEMNMMEDSDAPEYYNMQGVKIDTPAAGEIVIMKKGAIVKRVIFN